MPQYRSYVTRCLPLGMLFLGVFLLAGCAAPGKPQPEEKETSAVSQAEYVREAQRMMQEALDIENPPPVSVKQFADIDVIGELKRKCMTDAGFDPAQQEKSQSPEYLQAYDRQFYICEASYLPPQKYVKKWDKEAVRTQYRWTVEYVLPCLAALGYPVAAESVPSEQSFVDNFLDSGYWPVADVARFGDAAVEQAQESCLQQAPGAVMFDGLSIAEWKKLNRGGWWTGN